MQDSSRRMAGPYFVTPYEVYDMFAEMEGGQACKEVYEAILRHAFIEEDWEADEKWVVGKFRTSKATAHRWTTFSQSHFYRLWNRLIEAGFLTREKKGGYWLLPYYKLKKYGTISVIEIKRMASHQLLQDKQIQLLTTIIEELTGQPLDDKILMGGKKIEKNGNLPNTDGQDGKKPLMGGKKPLMGGNSSNQLDRDIIDRDPSPTIPSTGNTTGARASKEVAALDGGGDGKPFSEDQEWIRQELINIGVLEKKASEIATKFSLKRILTNLKSVENDRSRGGSQIKDAAAVAIWRIENNYVETKQKKKEGDGGKA